MRSAGSGRAGSPPTPERRPPADTRAEPGAAAGEYRVGIASWTDAALIASGRFYPRRSMSAEDRLRWYARFFDCVEVNSSFYALPSPRHAAQWAARTPAGFLFHVKAYGLMTGHHPRLDTLPPEIRLMLPESVPTGRRGEVDHGRLPPEARDRSFALFREAVAPLAEAGKLGYVLFQLAPWVRYGVAACDYLASLRERLPGWALAVEFRNESWIPRRTDEVLRLLADHGLAFVAVDAPWQPFVPAVTVADWAVMRLHGRNVQGWLDQRAGREPTVAEKYDYLYGAEELDDLAGSARRLRARARRTAVTFNNNNEDYPTRNALDLKRLLGLEAPDAETARATWRPAPRGSAPGDLFGGPGPESFRQDRGVAGTR
jgi:uncharacterized protein YecE (DUF72 family)